MLKVDMNGEPVEVVVTEVTPGRWSWSIRRVGLPSIGSTIPLPTGQAAMQAALDEIRSACAEELHKRA